MADIKYEIKKHIGVISKSDSGWTTELNLVSFNETEPKYDIRTWSPDKDKMSKGVRFNEEEMLKLIELFNENR